MVLHCDLMLFPCMANAAITFSDVNHPFFFSNCTGLSKEYFYCLIKIPLWLTMFPKTPTTNQSKTKKAKSNQTQSVPFLFLAKSLICTLQMSLTGGFCLWLVNLKPTYLLLSNTGMNCEKGFHQRGCQDVNIFFIWTQCITVPHHNTNVSW